MWAAVTGGLRLFHKTFPQTDHPAEAEFIGFASEQNSGGVAEQATTTATLKEIRNRK
jgi:hypothetical protein